MAIRTIIAAGSLAAICSSPNFAAEPARLSGGVPVTGTFSSPTGLAYDVGGGLYVTEWSANRVSHIDPNGVTRLVTDKVRSPSGIVVGPDGTVYVASYSEGVVHRLRSNGQPEKFVSDLRTPAGLSIGRDGTLLIADRGLNQILRADASGSTQVLARGLPTPVGVVEFADGTLVVSNFAGCVVEVRPGGVQRELTKGLGAPAVGIVADGADAVLVPDYSGTSVWRITRSGGATVLIQDLQSPVAMARSKSGSELAVGNWGDGSVRRYRDGAAR